MNGKYWKYWQHGIQERTAEAAVEFKRGKRIELGPSVDDYEPEPEPERFLDPELGRRQSGPGAGEHDRGP